MKRLLIIFIFTSSFTFAQEYSNFKIENGKLVYEKVIQESKSINELKSAISKIPGEIITEDSASISYKITDVFVPFESYGGKRMSSAMFVINPFSGVMTIQKKESRFRIQVSGLTYFDRAFTIVYPGANALRDFETSVLKKKKSEFRTDKSTLKGLEYYDRFFTEIFLITLEENNW